MNKVFLHVCNPGPGTRMDWSNSSREFSRLPIIGEYIATDPSSPWYKVVLVVHCPFDADYAGEYAAEVYALEVDHMDEKRKAFSKADV